MTFAQRRSLSEINLNKADIDENYNEPAKVNFELTTTQEDCKNPLELTASNLLFNRIKYGIKVASLHENQGNYMNFSSIYLNKASKRKKIFKFKKLKFEIYNLLEKPSGNFAFLYRLFTFSLILIPILFNAFTTMHKISKFAERTLFFIEVFVTTFFFLEYCLRVWSSGYRATYSGFSGKLKFMSKPIMIIELIISTCCSVVLFASFFQNYYKRFELKDYHLNSSALIFIRFFQLVRLLYVDRQAHTWVLLLDVISKHKYELITSVYIGFIILLLSSYLILIFEREHNTSFKTYSDAVYWSIITMTTIGYGDISPKTFYGKIIATGLCILGVAFWTLPGGIIGSGFALKVEQKNKIDQFNRLLPAAAILIQNWWRMKVIHEIPPSNTSRLVAVLKVFEAKTNRKVSLANAKRKGHLNQEILNKEQHIFDQTLFHNLDKKISIDETDLFQKGNDNDDNDSEKLIHKSAYNEEKERKNREYVFKKLNPQNLILLRTILILKFFVSKRKFKFAHKPYDFKDVIEQYTQGNMDILLKIKELQRKLDQSIQLQKNPSYLKIPPSKKPFASNSENKTEENNKALISIENKVNQVESHVSKLESRIDKLENKLDRILNVLEQK